MRNYAIIPLLLFAFCHCFGSAPLTAESERQRRAPWQSFYIINAPEDVALDTPYDRELRLAANGPMETFLEIIARAPAHADLGMAIQFVTQLDKAKALVEAGGRLDFFDSYGMNLLHIAVQNGGYEIVEYLLEKGLPVNGKDFHGRTPLFFSAGNLEPRIPALLIAKGAYVDTQDSCGTTPLMRAVDQRDLPLIRMLLKAGANYRIKNAEDKTALQIAQARLAESQDEERETVQAIIETLSAADDLPARIATIRAKSASR